MSFHSKAFLIYVYSSFCYSKAFFLNACLCDKVNILLNCLLCLLSFLPLKGCLGMTLLALVSVNVMIEVKQTHPLREASRFVISWVSLVGTEAIIGNGYDHMNNFSFLFFPMRFSIFVFLFLVALIVLYFQECSS